MASDCNRKRARPTKESLQHLLHIGGISTVGLAELLRTIRESDAPSVLEASRYSLRASADASFEAMRLSFELPLVDGGTFTWEVIDPLRMLAKAVELRPAFRALVSDAVRRSRPSLESPWHLAIGFDAFAPGHRVISLAHHRHPGGSN
jgi:hypothetical protein